MIKKISFKRHALKSHTRLNARILSFQNQYNNKKGSHTLYLSEVEWICWQQQHLENVKMLLQKYIHSCVAFNRATLSLFPFPFSLFVFWFSFFVLCLCLCLCWSYSTHVLKITKCIVVSLHTQKHCILFVVKFVTVVSLCILLLFLVSAYTCKF